MTLTDISYLALPVALVTALYLGRRFQHIRARRWLERGAAAFQAADYEGAAAAFRKCAKILPIWAPAQYFLGISLAHLGRFDEADPFCRLAADLEPRNAEAQAQYALFLLFFAPPERHDDAYARLERAVELAPRLRELLAADERLAQFRSDTRFAQLINADGTSE